MIQRIQTIYLFLGAMICFAFLFIPIASVQVELKAFDSFKTLDNLLAASFSCAILLLSLIIIFLYKNRPLQIRLIYIVMAFIFALLAYTYFVITKSEINYTIQILFYLPLLAIALNLLALRAIRKDEQLVKNMDRFR